VEARLKAGRPVLMTRRRFESMLGEGYLMFQYRGAIETTWTSSFRSRWPRAFPRGGVAGDRRRWTYSSSSASGVPC